MVVNRCPVTPKISVVIILVGTVVVMIFVAVEVVFGVDILPTSCVKQNVLNPIHNVGIMDNGAETAIRMVRSSPAWSGQTNHSRVTQPIRYSQAVQTMPTIPVSQVRSLSPLYQLPYRVMTMKVLIRR